MCLSLALAMFFGLSVIPAASLGAVASANSWVGSWWASPVQMSLKDGITDRTFRSVAHLSLGGTAVRIALTNQFGSIPLRIGAAHLGLSAGKGKIAFGSDHRLTFNDQLTVLIPPGSSILSDPLPMTLADFADVAISLYVPRQPVTEPTCHEYALSTTYIGIGDTTEQTEVPEAKTMPSTCFLESVLVRPRDKRAAAIVTLGDSITDGAFSTIDANRRYSDDLAVRLHTEHRKAHLAVLNAGIAGNRVLYGGKGPSALERFDRDVLAQPGVRYLIYLEGINDISQSLRADSPERDLTTSDLIFAAMQLVTRAHLHGVRVMGATLMPSGSKDPSDKLQRAKMQQIVDEYNEWVRNSSTFDAVVDFNKATADPADPNTLLPAFDSGDHTHPNDAGFKAMADAIDLGFFR